MGARDPIRIVGIEQLRKDLRGISKEAPKELAAEFKKIAAKLVPIIRARMPRRTGRAARNVRPRNSQRGVEISLGSSRVPYTPWLDFGGSTKRWPNGEISRPFVKKGRYAVPTVEDNRDEITADAEQAIERVFRRYRFKLAVIRGFGNG